MKLIKAGKAILKDRYQQEGESPKDLIWRSCTAYSSNKAHAKRMLSYIDRNWMMFSTPVLTNAPIRLAWTEDFNLNFLPSMFHKVTPGMPISCFLAYVPDSRGGITGHTTETSWLSTIGGGVGGHWSDIRTSGTKTSGGGQSTGMLPFLHVIDATTLAFSQGVTRRGSYAAYLDIGHPEIEAFIDMRKPTGGDINAKNLNLHHAVNIPDVFYEILHNCELDPNASDRWELRDPHTQEVIKVVSAKALWEKILETRVSTGEPYVFNIDTANRALPSCFTEQDMYIKGSNLCAEITLVTTEDRTAVCCLSSTNVATFDEWEMDPNFIEDVIEFLDNVLEYFIYNAPEAMNKAKFSAAMERSLGLGLMGFHTYLQQHNVPFESALATSANLRMIKNIKSKADEASRSLGMVRGFARDYRSDDPERKRNTHLLAIAPNASSSIICGGVSPSIEPIRANAYNHKTMSGSFLIKNEELEIVLGEHGLNTEEVWKQIITDGGSVRNVEGLTDWERDVFKTAMEIEQGWIIEHAGMRAPYICQAQSVNLFVPADVNIKYLHDLHMSAWKKGVKSLYYLRSEAINRAENVSLKIERQHLVDMPETCLSCEG